MKNDNYTIREFSNLIGTHVECMFLNVNPGELVRHKKTGENFIVVDQIPTWNGWSKVKVAGRFFKIPAYELELIN